MVNVVLSQALGRIAPSPTLAVSQKARELKAAGEDVIALAAGEPDFATPEHIAEAGIQAIRDGHTGYTAADGIPELKEAVAAKFERDNGLSYDPGTEVTVTSGGKYLIFAAMMATLNPGDEVVVPAPYWVSYPDIVKLCGGTPVIAETSEAAGFRLTPEVLEAAITPKTKWLILNSPSNPTGAVLSREDLRGLGEVLLRHPKIMVLSDDIYEHITYDAEFATIAEAVPALKERVLTMNGASKAYSMTGWRIGFGAGPKPLINAIRKLLSQSTTNPCSISQWAAVAALNGDHGFLAERNEAFRARRDHLLSVFADAPGLSVVRPEGAFYLYPKVEGLIGRSLGGRMLETDLDVATALLEEEKVALVPGTAFGTAPYLRLSYAASMAEIEEASQRITRFCERLAE
ncbi:pyridoxal phosphate-dependent aminotransferase [Parvularcula maris]|uniref:Aminotransferase n=1 Tax=Parvularcula maris TaxID=2965077 RepID=A0A9X2LBJ2_9PROT|nr:pyridoxal phosphate-dependent aminotransferase [Parvularcula maris]MCQ8186650.1 pyridoxal phosphate-dependent aminotransferase [Parvularcula maris]